MSRIYVIHENDAWVEPLRAAFAESGLPFDEWFLERGRARLPGAAAGRVLQPDERLVAHARPPLRGRS